MKAKKHLVLAYAVLIWTNFALAGILDDFPDLEGKTIQYAGEFERVQCPISGKYDCLNFPSNLLRVKGKVDFCINTDHYNGCAYDCKGLIAVGSGFSELYLFESSIGNDMKKYRFKSYRCPDLY